MKHLKQKLLLIALLLLSVVYAEAETFTIDGINYTTNDDGVTCYVSGSSSSISGTVSIPDDVYGYAVTAIGDYAFSNRKNITAITIGKNVTSIGVGAFNACRNLATIDIPNSVTSIDDRAFSICESLAEINIPNSVTSIGDRAFYSCKSLAEINIPNSVTSIGDRAFDGCKSLAAIDIPNSVTSIGDGIFKECSSLSSITVDENNPVYDSRYGCNAIINTSTNELLQGCKATVIPNSVTSIGDSAFAGCSFTTIEIPNSVTSIGVSAFAGCSLTTIEIPNSVTSIGNGAFENSCLTSVTIPSSVTSIGNETFYYCGGLTSIEIPNSVTTIGNSAFFCCTSLTTIEIPNSVTSIGSTAFSGSGITSVTIPNSVTTIDKDAFWACEELKKVTINSTTLIEKDYTTGDTGTLLDAVAPNNCLTSIFGEKVENYILNGSYTKIGNNAFYKSSGLKSITLDSQLKNIGTKAFYGCSSLNEMICKAAKIPVVDNNAFDGSGYQDGTLYVPAESVNLYSAAYPWYGWGNIKSLDDFVPEDKDGEPCAEPTIEYADGKLIITSETEGAKCYYAISCADVATEAVVEGDISLVAAYEISAFASAENHSRSAETKTLLVFNLEDNGETSVEGITIKSNPVIIKTSDGNVMISGIKSSSVVDFYSVEGRMLGRSNVINGETMFSCNGEQTVIIKIGNKTIKAIVK